MKIYFSKMLSMLLIAIGFSSCVNLKHVSEFSTSCLEGITAFENIAYGFEQYCLEGCRDDRIRDFDITNNECKCELDKQADSITLKIYNSVFAYFEGLYLLSNNELTTYQTEDLENSLSTGDFGPINIDQENAASHARVSKILIRAFTDTYRRNKIREYIKEANEPIMNLLAFLDFNLSSNLNGKLEVSKERLKADYFDFLKDTSLSTLEKRRIMEDYFQKLKEIEAIQQQFTIYSEILVEISKGHQKLAENADKLNILEIKQVLLQYASDIQTMIVEFKKIQE